MRLRFPHPLVLLLGGVGVAAMLTWILPAGEFDRRLDEATGRQVVVAGTYHPVAATPVGPFAACIAIAQGFVEAADVIAVVLFVGGAWVLVDKLGALRRLVGSLASSFRRRTWLAIPVVSMFFASMGALENMQEEIIPLVPVLLLFGRRLGVDAITVVAMSAGAAMIGSAFGPTNPFQAGIAMKLAELPPMSSAGARSTIFVVATAVWIAWTVHYATTRGRTAAVADREINQAVSARDVLMIALMLAPMAAYVYGAALLGWGFNQLSAGFLVGAIAAGLVGRMGATGTAVAYLEGMQIMLPAAMLIGVARSLSLVFSQGHVIDTILSGLSAPLAGVSGIVAALLMLPFHAVVHVFVPSVSGHAVLTMPVLVPLSDLVGVSRSVTVLAYQLGAGLTELLTPTNGALMAVLLAAGVSFGAWLRFALVATLVTALVGIAGMVVLG